MFGSDSQSASGQPFWRWIAGAAIALYLLLAAALSYTREPFCDEAWFNSPALNLATKGYMGTSYLDPASNIGKPQIRLDGIDRYTYWMPPLYMVTEAGWIKAIGFSLLRVRLASILWGLIALLAWWAVASRLAGPFAASITVLLLGVEYNWIFAAADARMEAMCAALGTMGLAAFLRDRELHFTRGIILANIAIAAAALTHPMGVTYGLVLVVMVFYRDRSQLSWRHLLLSAPPYVIAIAAWALYIAQAPDIFRLQFTGNISARGPGLTHPFAAFLLELTHRYGESFGLAPWTSGPARVKILVLALYVAGFVWVACSRRLKPDAGIRLVLACAASVLIFYWLFEGTKNSMYLPHILPWLCIAAAIAICDMGEDRTWIAAFAVAVIVGVQVLSTALPARRNPYHRLFDPAMNYLASHSGLQDTIMGDAVIGYALGFDRSVVDDAWFGYNTGRVPEWVVITPVYASLLEGLPKSRPEVYRHISGLLSRYNLAFENEGYRIYRRRDVRQ